MKTLKTLSMVVIIGLLLFAGANILVFVGHLAIATIGLDAVAYILISLFFASMLAYPIVLGFITKGSKDGNVYRS